MFSGGKQGMGPGRLWAEGFSGYRRWAGRQWAGGLVMISDGQADNGQRDLVVIGNGQGKDG